MKNPSFTVMCSQEISTSAYTYLITTVADPNPDPDPPEPYVFGHPGSGSGSISQRYGSGSFYHKAKTVKLTNLIPTVCDFFYFLSLKNDVNVPSKSNKQKNFF